MVLCRSVDLFKAFVLIDRAELMQAIAKREYILYIERVYILGVR